MYLFTRRIVVNPSQFRTGLAHAIEMTKYVNQNSDLEVSLFEVLQGESLGTLTFAYPTESYSASLESVDALIHSDEYLAEIERGGGFFVGNPVDQLGAVVHTAGEVSGPPAAAITYTITIDMPRIAEAMTWAVELTNYVSNLAGLPIQLLSSSFGQQGEISWIASGQSVAQVVAAQEKGNSDLGYLQRIAETEGFFVAGSGAVSLSRRIA